MVPGDAWAAGVPEGAGEGREGCSSGSNPSVIGEGENAEDGFGVSGNRVHSPGRAEKCMAWW